MSFTHSLFLALCYIFCSEAEMNIEFNLSIDWRRGRTNLKLSWLHVTINAMLTVLSHFSLVLPAFQPTLIRKHVLSLSTGLLLITFALFSFLYLTLPRPVIHCILMALLPCLEWIEVWYLCDESFLYDQWLTFDVFVTRWNFCVIYFFSIR